MLTRRCTQCGHIYAIPGIESFLAVASYSNHEKENGYWTIKEVCNRFVGTDSKKGGPLYLTNTDYLHV